MRRVQGWPITSGPIMKAQFLARPNRFLVRCVSEKLGEIAAFLPNPGRLWELLLPGATVYFRPVAKSEGEGSSTRKTAYTVLAVERQGRPIFLHTHATNQVARFLVERGLIAPLQGARVVKAEVPVGNSRFDFLLRSNDKDLYMEVKSCTLFGNGVAMFPDAVTKRGRRHLLELADMGRRGIQSMILFLIHYPHVRWFMPDYHTDLAFGEALLEARQDVQILPVAVGWKNDLTLDEPLKVLQIPWAYLQREVKDRGSYLLLLKLEQEKKIAVGRLGRRNFWRGYYIYVGSAMRHLTARMARHGRKHKKPHWHIDYLTQEADGLASLPVRSSQRLECEMAQALSLILEQGPAGFGSSDCPCFTHLFWSPENPLHTEAFHHMLQGFRMRSP
jgi:sugar fermentation stimulation protein A